jgi:hypothetical protein
MINGLVFKLRVYAALNSSLIALKLLNSAVIYKALLLFSIIAG